MDKEILYEKALGYRDDVQEGLMTNSALSSRKNYIVKVFNNDPNLADEYLAMTLAQTMIMFESKTGFRFNLEDK